MEQVFSKVSNMPKRLIKRWLPDQDKLKEHKHLRLFGKLLLDASLWHLNRRSAAGAFAVGLFMAWIPLPCQMLLAAGGAIWVGQGHSKDEYKAAAKFLEFTLTPQTQLSIARIGGFLPLTPAAQAGAQSKLLRDDLQSQDLGLANVMKAGAPGATAGWISLNPQLRQIVNEEMDAVFMGKKSAKTALDTAVARGQVVYNPLPTVPTKASGKKARK
jgi:ABC-type glycerol-3-phosphate transport system substrate-binding protein